MSTIRNQRTQGTMPTPSCNGPDSIGGDKAKPAYYAKASIQMSASDGAKNVDDVDSKLKDTILSALAGQGDGRISLADMKNILNAITDGPLGEPAYSKGEAPLVRMLLAATDDRSTVKLDGNRVRIEDGAERLIETTLPKFWGSIGGKTAAANRAAAANNTDDSFHSGITNGADFLAQQDLILGGSADHRDFRRDRPDDQVQTSGLNAQIAMRIEQNDD